MTVEIGIRINLSNSIDNVVELLQLTTNCTKEFVCVSSVVSSINIKKNIVCDVLLNFSFIDDVFVNLGSKSSLSSSLVTKLSFHSSIFSSLDSIFLTLFFIGDLFCYSFISQS